MAARYAKLDRTAVRHLKPGEKITERGITAERLSNGELRYSVNIMADGQRIHRVIGRESDGTTRTQAEEFIAKARSEAKNGRLKLPKGRKIGLTFKRATEIYMQRLAESGGRGLAEKEQHFRLYMIPELGTMPLDRISRFTLERLRKKYLTHGASIGTFNRQFATDRHMANKLLEWELVDSPLPTLKLQRTDRRRDYVLTAAEKAELLAAALKDSNTRIWLFIQVGLHTSLRHAEILSARFEHFDPVRRRLHVTVKGGRQRAQPLTLTITEILQREQEMAADPDGWIFPNSLSKSGHTESMKAPFRRTALRAGLDPTKATPHTLRHTAITEMAETGAEARTIQAFSGHQSREMVWRYTHARNQRINEAMERFDAASTEPERLEKRKRPRS